ncbi:MAG: response regulator [Candidatus Riflebacteria bacterium]|nr:response regulator [Candidatus Riflebacteria bacterium]
MKILVVEDDDATRSLMAMIIKRQGHETVSAPDGLEGLKTFKTFQPDVVFTDIQMPNMDGLEMLEKIRKLDSNALVIVNSTLDAPQYTLKALRLKANDYLVKPVMEKDIITLLNKYAQVMQSRTRTREVYGLIYQRNLGMKIFNQLDLVCKIVDRLMLETEHALPEQDRLGIHLGLVEMLANAIEHGNLQITYDEKTEALEGASGDWLKLVETRTSTAPYEDRTVNLEFNMSKERCEWLITDQGPGFAWNDIPDPNDPENLLASHGRGIMLTRLQFDECSYLGSGNQVRLVKHLS